MTDNISIKDELSKLFTLQELDFEIYDLTIHKEVFPGRIKELDDSLETKTTGMKAAEEKIKHLQVTKNDKENEMQSKEEKISKHESELYQIKNNKEYKALQQEIDSIKADISLLEEDIINLFDEIESAQASYEEEKKLFEVEKGKSEKEKADIKAEEKKIQDRLTELKAFRSETASGIDQSLLQRYEKILEHRGRAAMAKLNGEICGECGMLLRPQIINDARLKKELIFCESCTRILYAEE